MPPGCCSGVGLFQLRMPALYPASNMFMRARLAEGQYFVHSLHGKQRGRAWHTRNLYRKE